jgi:hypothetical protein
VTAREDRARARAQWTGRLVAGMDPGEEEPLQLSSEEAWLEVGRLTRLCWLMSGGTEDFLPRSEWPGRLFRRGEARDDGDSR